MELALGRGNGMGVFHILPGLTYSQETNDHPAEPVVHGRGGAGLRSLPLGHQVFSSPREEAL